MAACGTTPKSADLRRWSGLRQQPGQMVTVVAHLYHRPGSEMGDEPEINSQISALIECLFRWLRAPATNCPETADAESTNSASAVLIPTTCSISASRTSSSTTKPASAVRSGTRELGRAWRRERVGRYV